MTSRTLQSLLGSLHDSDGLHGSFTCSSRPVLTLSELMWSSRLLYQHLRFTSHLSIVSFACTSGVHYCAGAFCMLKSTVQSASC